MHTHTPMAASEQRGQPNVLRFPPGGTNLLAGFNPKAINDKQLETIAALDAYPEPRGLWDRLAQSRVFPFSRPMAYGVSAIHGGAELEDVLKPWHECVGQLRALYRQVHRRPALSWKERLLRLVRVDSHHDVTRAEAMANPQCPATRKRNVEVAEHEAFAILDWAAEERRELGLSPRRRA